MLITLLQGFSMKRFLLTLLPLLLLLGVVAPSASAVEIVKDDTIAKDQVIDDDVIMSGENLVIDGTIQGALIATGATVEINGMVEGDLIVSAVKAIVNGTVQGNVFASGQDIHLNGQVGGSVMTAAALLQLGPEAQVARNVYAAVFSFETAAGAQTTRDAAVATYQALHAGEIGRNLYTNVAALEISGKIGGDVVADIAAPAESPQFFKTMPWAHGINRLADKGLRVTADAEIGGDLKYTSSVEQSEAIQAQPKGEVVFTKDINKIEGAASAHPTYPEIIATWALDRVRDLLTFLILGVLAVWQVPALLNQLAATAQAKPLLALGWGFVTLIGGVVMAGAVMLIVVLSAIALGIVTLGELAQTVISLGVGAVGLSWALFGFAITYGSKLVVIWWVGQAVWNRLSPNTANPTLTLGLGVVTYVILSGLPGLGLLVMIAVTLIGLGAMWLTYQDWRGARRNSAAPAAESA
jgi:cytoskeletal protein CcmA (bactofilin family)